MVDPRERMQRLAHWHPNRRRRRRLNKTMFSLAGIGGAATALGAGLMYLLDPQGGRRRRHVARDRSVAMLRRGRRRLERFGRRAVSEVEGFYQRALHLRGYGEPAPNDEALADRVRSEIFRDLDRHGRVNVNVEEGVVVLRGQLERDEEIRSLTEATKRVHGVRDVQSYLHLPDSPAPNKRAVYDLAGADAEANA